MLHNRTAPPALLELQRSTNPAAQICALRAIKNQLVGHEERKIELISHGVIPLLSELLRCTKAGAKQSDRRHGRCGKPQRQPPGDSSEQNLVIQATNVLGVIAQGNTSFVRPILDSHIIVLLLEMLSAASTNSRVSLAVLNCLNVIANNLPSTASNQWALDMRLSDLLYSPQHLECWTDSIRDTATTSLAQQICASAMSLVCATCTDNRQKKALVDAGILLALSNKLASFVVAQGLVVPSATVVDGVFQTFRTRSLPGPAQSKTHLTTTLQALALIVDQSKEHAEQVLAMPALAAVFPMSQEDDSGVVSLRGSWTKAPAHIQANVSNPIDRLLPLVPGFTSRISAEHLNFPPLGSIAPEPRWSPSCIPSGESIGVLVVNTAVGIESPLVSWLIYVIRAETGVCRLMAAKLLVALHRLELTSRSRLPLFCKMLVPMLVRMLDRDHEMEGNSDCEHRGIHHCGPSVIEQAPAVLADLVMDDESLQAAAVDARAIKKLSQELKTTFEPLLQNGPAPWSPQRAIGRREELKSIPGSRSSHIRLARRMMSYRENILKALAALAPFNDEYRKAICDQGILPCIVDSLKPMGPPPNPNDQESKFADVGPGNPASTLIAACGAIRALTRSVSALRTSLIDAGIADPVLKLLTNPDPEIRIAATKVVGNLAMDFSPMKETIGNQHVIKTLCEHAHSANPRLRFESVWALKQLVVNGTNTLKKCVIQELGPSWIKQLISTDPADIPPGVVIGLTDINFHASNLYSVAQANFGEDVIMNDLDAVNDGALTGQNDPMNRHTVDDDRAIQEQLLDLVRNLFCGETASEIIEYVFAEMGQRDFIDILLARIRPRVIHGATRKENKSTPSPVGVVLKVLYIIIHICASMSKFRNVVAAHAPLLRQVLTYSNHPQSTIRAQCAWIAINLTYEDDPADRASCKHRASELQRVGYVTKLMAMGEDVDLDVRERTKTAIHLIRQLLS